MEVDLYDTDELKNPSEPMVITRFDELSGSKRAAILFTSLFFGTALDGPHRKALKRLESRTPGLYEVAEFQDSPLGTSILISEILTATGTPLASDSLTYVYTSGSLNVRKTRLLRVFVGPSAVIGFEYSVNNLKTPRRIFALDGPEPSGKKFAWTLGFNYYGFEFVGNILWSQKEVLVSRLKETGKYIFGEEEVECFDLPNEDSSIRDTLREAIWKAGGNLYKD